MKPAENIYEPIYLLIGAVHLIGEIFQNEMIWMVTKPLLMPALIGMIILDHHKKSGYRMTITAGLFFSWIGDVLLMFASQSEIFFILGLIGFLIAHIFYIVAFGKAYKKISSFVSPGLKIVFIVLSVVYAYLLFTYLSDNLDALFVPVLIYSMVITTMLIFSLNRFNLVSGIHWLLTAVGAVFFIVSDSILAINKFDHPVSNSGFLIMLTYISAQYFIAKGALEKQSLNEKESF